MTHKAKAEAGTNRKTALENSKRDRGKTLSLEDQWVVTTSYGMLSLRRHDLASHLFILELEVILETDRQVELATS